MSACFPGEEPLQQDEYEEQASDDDLGPPGAERSVVGDEGLDNPEHEHANDRSKDVAGSAGQQGAADDNCGDGIEFHSLGCEAVAGEAVEGEQNSGDGGAEAAQCVDQDFGP